MTNFLNQPELYKPRNGETFFELRNRAASFLTDLQATFQTGNVLIVTHSILIKTLISIFRDQKIETIWDPPYIHNSSLTVVEINQNKYNFLAEGDISFKSK